MSEKDSGSGPTEDPESEHESEDETQILEESPCGRWLKRSEEVSQRNVPGIDRAYLAMDSEEGVEVVWNEVQFSERKSYKAQEQQIRAVFDNLTRIDHANIVKFHRYWIDQPKKDSQKTRVIFITEYMSSGSVKKFLNKTKEIHKYKSTKSWKRWCRQILSALSYLHSCDPPIVHGNLTCDTIFIQHNGLLKIGSVAPDAIRNHIKTYLQIQKNLHYFAPECTDTQGSGNITPAVDIYSFGICALEMALPKTHLNAENKRISTEDIEKAITMLDDTQQQLFIRLCMTKDPNQRPSARELLLHPVLFEVHSLKLLSAHAFVKNQEILPENQMDMYKLKEKRKANVLATVAGKEVTEGDIDSTFDVDKFVEDVRNGIYPLTAFALPKPPPAQVVSQTPGEAEGEANGPGQRLTPTQQEIPPESRKIVHAQCCCYTRTDKAEGYHIVIQLRFEDKMNRQLRCDIGLNETPKDLATELVHLNFIHETDVVYLTTVLTNLLRPRVDDKSCVTFHSGDVILRPNEVTNRPADVEHPTPLASIAESHAEAYSQINNNNNYSSDPLSPLLMSPLTPTPEHYYPSFTHSTVPTSGPFANAPNDQKYWKQPS
uniref:Nuclear receptor-binding protein homolog n=1 Tax=Ciona savignyi TaxID=51511 RepID=H2YSQ8_CIOSA